MTSKGSALFLSLSGSDELLDLKRKEEKEEKSSVSFTLTVKEAFIKTFRNLLKTCGTFPNLQEKLWNLRNLP